MQCCQCTENQVDFMYGRSIIIDDKSVKMVLMKHGHTCKHYYGKLYSCNFEESNHAIHIWKSQYVISKL